MKQKTLFFSVGFIVLVCGLFLNMRHTMNDYGIGTNPQHLEVLAQSSSSGGGEGTGGILWKKHEKHCTIKVSGQIWSVIKIWGTNYTIPYQGELIITFENVNISCESGGGFQCITKDCADFWKGSGAPGSGT